MDVLTLLKSKNRCLERFLALSVDYLENAGPALDDLPAFQDRRESTLKAMDLYDRKVTELVSEPGAIERTPELVSSVSHELARKDELVRRILEVDLLIIGRIEEAKKRIFQELSSSRRQQHLLGKFKSGWVSEGGTELDERL